MSDLRAWPSCPDWQSHIGSLRLPQHGTSLRRNVGWRQAAAAAITFGATAEQLSQVDLAYAPPYSAAMDNLIVAADILKNKLAGQARGISSHQVKRKFDEEDDFILLDVRSPAEHGEIGIEGAKLIPLGMLRERLEELPKDKEIVTFCKISLRGYEAQKILDAAGFQNTKFMDGGILAWPYPLRGASTDAKRHAP